MRSKAVEIPDAEAIWEVFWDAGWYVADARLEDLGMDEDWSTFANLEADVEAENAASFAPRMLVAGAGPEFSSRRLSLTGWSTSMPDKLSDET
jgi:hypothetical protein